jgi:flagellar protein FliJ
MSKFRFTLQPVLNQRLLVEQAAQRETARCEQERFAIQRELELLRAQESEERRELGEQLRCKGSLDPAQLRLQSVASMQVSRRMREAALRLAGAKVRSEESRQVLVKATAGRRAMELIRDQQEHAWRARAQRRETELLDEMAMAMRRLAGPDEFLSEALPADRKLASAHAHDIAGQGGHGAQA